MYSPGRSSYFPALCPPRSLRRDILSAETTSKLRAPLAEHWLPDRARQSLGSRPSLGERVIKHLDQRRTLVSVGLAFVQLDQLLDLLADRYLCLALLGHHQVAALRAGLEECPLGCGCDLIGLLVLAPVRKSRFSTCSLGRVLADIGFVVAGLDDADGDAEGCEVPCKRIGKRLDGVLAH